MCVCVCVCVCGCVKGKERRLDGEERCGRSALSTCFVGKTYTIYAAPAFDPSQSQHVLKERTFETKTEHIHTFVWTMHIICKSTFGPVF